MEQKNQTDKFHSLPNVRKSSSVELDIRRIYSLSLSQIKKHAEFAEYHHKPSPFNIRWIHGYNAKVGVINLNDRGSTTVFYAAGNCAVLFNWTTNQMRILQGHRHVVSFIASDSQGKWLITADSGPENILIIWDSSDYFPQRTIFLPHKETKLSKVALSADAKYLLTLGYEEKASIFWWIWSIGLDEPHGMLLNKTQYINTENGRKKAHSLSSSNRIKMFKPSKNDLRTVRTSLTIRRPSQRDLDTVSVVFRTDCTTDENIVQVRVGEENPSPHLFSLSVTMTRATELKHREAKLEVDLPKDSIIAMEFNPHNSKQFLLMTKNDIWIGVSGKVFVMERGLIKETDDYELKIRKPEKKIHPDLGFLTCFTFVKDTSQVLVATSRGAVLIYGYTIEYQENVDDSNYENLKFVKVLKIEKYRINVIKSIDGFVITGNNSGEIHFYDDQMKLLYWIHGFQVDSVKGLSFNISPRSYKIFDPKCNKLCPCWEKVVMDEDPETGTVRQKVLKKKIPSDATTEGKPIVVRDFIVCTQNQGVGFVDYVVEKNHIILDNKPSHALSISVHPEKPFVCIGYADGILELFNFIQHKLFVRINLREHYKVVIPPKDDSIKCNYEVNMPELSVTCLKYSPSGLHLACGLNTGEIIFLDPTTIEILTQTPFKDTNHAIKEINYSCDSLTMAFADISRTVGVYKYDCDKFVWNFVGKHRAHYKDVTAVFFLPERNIDGEYKLLSLGADRIMVEYDVGQSSDEYLEVFSLDRMEQTAVPLTGIVWPVPPGLDQVECRPNLPTILIANDENKYKIINYSTTMTMATVLGPRYEHPVSRMQLISRKEEEEVLQYLVFATKNVIGMQKMPLDGNPWKHVGLLGHPLQIIGMCFREDSGTLFTIGSKDSCMYQWAANYRSVETTIKLGGGDLDPYYCLIENGRPGWLFQEIRDLFYYIQILCQGTFSPAVRRVKDYIPIDSLPDLMRALGFFPTEYEVENLIVEAKYKVYQRHPSTEIDFEEFVKLYLNHRPAFGDSFKRLRAAFQHFATFNNDVYAMHRDEFVDMLAGLGECFPPTLSWYLLSILSGHSFEDRAAMAESDFSFLPEEITFSDLVTNIIGITEVDNISEQFSTKDSYGSQQTASSVDSEEKSY